EQALHRFRDGLQPTTARAEIVTVAVDATEVDPRERVVECAGQKRKVGRAQDRLKLAVIGNFEGMTNDRETGDIGDRMRTSFPREVGRVAVEQEHAGHGGIEVYRVDKVAL